MNKRKSRYIIIPFLTIVFVFFILNIIIPNQKYSVTENRNLEMKPTLEDIESGDFPSKFERYYDDNFIFRDKLISIDTKMEYILNKTKVGNYYLEENNWILGMFPRILNEKQLYDQSKAINELSDISTDLGKDVYFTMMPHKSNMLKHLYPKYIDDIGNIDINRAAFISRLNTNIIKYIDMDSYFLDQFNEEDRENLYLKTDHHWTGVGAFEGFKMMTKGLELDISSEQLEEHFDKYTETTVEDKDFIGSYNRNIGMVVKEIEYPSYAYIKGAEYEYILNEKKVNEEEVLATSRKEDEWDYGGAYIRGAQTNILNIKNENALVDKKILIFRDSYQAPTTWLFADLFNEVEIADPRNIENIDMTYSEIINNSDSDIVMFMYNSSGFDSMIDTMIKKGIK